MSAGNASENAGSASASFSRAITGFARDQALLPVLIAKRSPGAPGCVPNRSLGAREGEGVPGSPRQRGESVDAVLRNRVRKPVRTPRCGSAWSVVSARGCPARESPESVAGRSCEFACGAGTKFGGASSK